jgi:hypothetical protein
MRNPEKQRVACLDCGWSGGRTNGAEVLTRPCFKCGGPVERAGGVYVEARQWAGCRCGWYGEMIPQKVGEPCNRCGQATGLAYVVLEDGTVLAS